MHRTSRAAVVLTILSAVPSVTGGDVYFHDLGEAGGGGSVAAGISADGRTVVGYRRTATGAEAVAWRDLSPVPLGLFENVLWSEARACSADGSVMVGYMRLDDESVPVVWRDGVPTALPLPPGITQGLANAVSADGEVIVGTGPRDTFGSAGLRWDANGEADRFEHPDAEATAFEGVSADGAVMTGSISLLTGGAGSFRWDGAWLRLDDLSDPPDSSAWAISGDGTVIVGEGDVPGVPEVPVRWDGAEIAEIGVLPGCDCGQAKAVSYDGSVIVGLDPVAWFWTATTGIRSVQELLEVQFGISLPGWTLAATLGVSADGTTMCGYGTDLQGRQQAWIARIDLPCGRGDLNFDGAADLADLALLLSHFGRCDADPGYWPPADIDGRGCVDLPDLAILLAGFGTTCQ